MNELKKGSNVLYLKVIHKPFQPKLEVIAVSTMMTLTSDNFLVWFPIIYFQKGYWVK